jgi:predicted NBD/HSP70 family sugar kinase
MLRFGIDLGGTKTEGAILGADGRERFRERAASSAIRSRRRSCAMRSATRPA